MLLDYVLPKITRSGFIKSFIAVPYARNYGLLAMVYFLLFYFVEVASIIPLIIYDVPIGTVDFYTRITFSYILCSL